MENLPQESWSARTRLFFAIPLSYWPFSKHLQTKN